MTQYDRIRMLWPDHLGIARGKYLPTHLAERGTGHCVTTFGIGYDRSLTPAPGSYLLEGLRDVVARYDPDDLHQGWEDDTTGVVVGHLDFEGEPYPYAPRFALQQAVAAWEAQGYSPRIGLELEAYVIEPDGKGGWQPWSTPRSFVYGTGRSADPTGLIDEIMRTAWKCGFRLESINAEYDEGQFELTLEHDTALRAADDAFLFRVLAREVALSRGLDLTFLGKPFPGISGSGVHVNMSLTDADGNNAFADPAAEGGISALARQCIGGLCQHHQALTAICAPTVNAYRRLQAGELSGYWANWGFDHRMSANRVPEARGSGTRIESRVADGAVNTHLGVAAVLQAALLGVTGDVACPPPETGDGFESATHTTVCAPPNLLAALEALSADTDFVAALGNDVCENFIANKTAEWERYVASEDAMGDDARLVRESPSGSVVSHWELNEYLMYH